MNVTSTNRAEALLPLWVEQAEIAWRWGGEREAERILRDGLDHVALHCEVGNSTLPTPAKRLILDIAALGPAAVRDARRTLRSVELEAVTRRAGITARAS